MDMKRHMIETLTLVVVAVVIAFVSNSVASRERKLAPVGNYPDAQTVPARTTAATPDEAVAPVEPDVSVETEDPVVSARERILDRFQPTPDTTFSEISGDDVAWLWAVGATILDARRTSVYEQGHITGARSFPVWESDINDRVAALFEELPDQEMPIVVYCSGGDCEDSHMLADKLFGVFFSNVLVYRDGFPDWQERGGSVDIGPEN